MVCPVTDKVPVLVDPTFKLPVIPTPPPTTRAPDVLSIDGVVKVDKFNLPVFDNKFPDVRVISFTVIFPAKYKSDERPREPPIFKSPPTPIPPDTTNAPVVLLNDGVWLFIETTPFNDISPIKFDDPPTFKLLPIPAPPVTKSAPVPILPDCVAFVMEKGPDTIFVPLNVVFPPILILLLIVVFPNVFPIIIFVASPPIYMFLTPLFAIFNVELFDNILAPSFICKSPPEIRTVPDISNTKLFEAFTRFGTNKLKMLLLP